MYRDIPQELRALVEPVVQDHGLELVDAAVTRGLSGEPTSVSRCSEVSSGSEGPTGLTPFVMAGGGLAGV